MATFYVGYRNVLKGRNSGDNVHFWKGTVGEYSNYSLFNSSNILDGAPDVDAVPGVERPYSNVGFLEYIFAGGQHIAPMLDPGEGPRYEGGRFRPLEYKGLAGAAVFQSGYGGIETDYARYSNYIFDGLSVADILAEPGNLRRFNTTFGGAFDPYVWKGVGDEAMSDPGQPLPVGYDNPYGKNKVQEWRGVPSALAL